MTMDNKNISSDPKKQEALQKIEKLVSENAVVLFMKGDPENPRCGFSGFVVKVLNGMGVKFQYLDVLSDDLIRNAAKEYADWPTFPQLYVKGELIGGCDIVRDMALSGELADKLVSSGINS